MSFLRYLGGEKNQLLNTWFLYDSVPNSKKNLENRKERRPEIAFRSSDENLSVGQLAPAYGLRIGFGLAGFNSLMSLLLQLALQRSRHLARSN